MCIYFVVSVFMCLFIYVIFHTDASDKLLWNSLLVLYNYYDLQSTEKPTRYSCRGSMIICVCSLLHQTSVYIYWLEHAMKAYRRNEVKIHMFLISTLAGSEGSSSSSDCFIPSIHYIGGWVGPRTGFDVIMIKKPLPLTGHQTQVIQSIASLQRYCWKVLDIFVLYPSHVTAIRDFYFTFLDTSK